MLKMSSTQAGQMMKMAAANLRALSEENQGLHQQNADLMQKVAHFEKKAHAERIATAMEDKNFQPELSFQEKVAKLMERDDLTVFEQAVGLQAPQMKLASVHEDGEGVAEPGTDGAAATAFTAQLVSIE